MSVHSGRLLRTSQTGENYLLVLLQTASVYYNINYAVYGNAVLCYVQECLIYQLAPLTRDKDKLRVVVGFCPIQFISQEPICEKQDCSLGKVDELFKDKEVLCKYTSLIHRKKKEKNGGMPQSQKKKKYLEFGSFLRK